MAFLIIEHSFLLRVVMLSKCSTTAIRHLQKETRRSEVCWPVHLATKSFSCSFKKALIRYAGVRSGVSGYAILHRTPQGHTFALIELKRSKKHDSITSKEQVDFLLSRELQGGFCCIAYGAAAARAVVEWLYKEKPLK